MTKKFYFSCMFALLSSTLLWAETEVNVETAGTLPSLITSSDAQLKVTGVINGTDIKFIRELVVAGTVTSLDWSGVSIVAGGEAYTESYTTTANTIGEKMFYDCSKLQSMVLPQNTSVIRQNAFARTGLSAIDIPNTVSQIGGDAFAYCEQLSRVVVGSKVRSMGQGVFYSSPVKEAYVFPTTPPSITAYLFSSNPVIHVYASALAAYQKSKWAEFGTLVGDLDDSEEITSVPSIPYEKEPNEEKGLTDSPVYDLFGRRVTEMRPGTIYIRNGRKISIAP